jgi:ATP-dependent Clp protease ATP-binding subunit ClpC
MTRPPNIQDTEREIEKIKEEKEAAIKAQDFELAASLRDKEKQARRNWNRRWPNGAGARRKADCHHRRRHHADRRQVDRHPAEPHGTEGRREAAPMEAELRKTVIGQDEAVVAISKALRRSRADLKDPNRPIGSFVFLGPTGVGKTLMARALAEFMFGDQDALIQLDMSEYMEKFNVSRLVGSPPGYVGYEEGGQLTERVRRRPYSVVLFDEIEKAHPDVMNMLLQILEDGHLTDSLGRKVDFRNCAVIMTSNIGADTIRKAGELGFAPAKEEHVYGDMKGKLLEEAKRAFKPEFMNRLDDIIVFHT